MSLVITPRLSSVPSSRQSRAISELLPVPTGPATPSRRDRWTGGWKCSGTEETPLGSGVQLGPVLDLRCGGRGDLLDGAQVGDPRDHRLDLLAGRDRPGDGNGRIERLQLH